MVRRARLAQIILGVIVALATSSPAVQAANDPPTVFGHGTRAGIVAGVGAPDNQVFLGVQDFHSKAKVLLSFNTTPALGFPTPVLVGIAYLPGGGQVPFGSATQYTISTDPPAIMSPVGSLVWVPSQEAYHVTVDIHAPLPFSADLWLKGPTGAAALPTFWDGQTSFLNEGMGAGRANGTITFPGSLIPTQVHDWGAEQDTEYGTYTDGTQIGNPPNHVGYEYAASDNPDGSADFLLDFIETDGVWRGMLAHTSATGEVRECEPSTIGLSEWRRDPLTGFSYPLVVSASCPAEDVLVYPAGSAQAQPGTEDMSMTWSTTPADVALLPAAWCSFIAADSAVHSSVPGSVGVMQHFREVGSYGQTPATAGSPQPALVQPTPSLAWAPLGAGVGLLPRLVPC